MTSKDKLIKQCNEHDDVSYKLIPARWPFNYNDNKAYEVSMVGVKEKLYFYFNDEGDLLEKKVLY